MLPNTILDLKFGLNCGWEPVRPWDCFHRHDEVEMLFSISDQAVIYRFGGNLIEIKPRQTVLFWGALPHQLVEIERDALQYWLTVPPAVFMRWQLPEELIRDIFHGVMLFDDDPQLRALDLALFPLWKDELCSADPVASGAAEISIEARFRRFAARSYGINRERPQVIQHLNNAERDQFMTMYDYVAQHYREDLYIEDIAAAAHLHPNYAITLFKKKCGVNIMDLVSLLRVFEAQRLLLTTDMKVIDIAMEAGFTSVSNFYKTFNRINKKTPRHYRADAVSRPVFAFPCAFE